MPPAGRRPDYDQALKRLLTDAHDGVLALLLPGARWVGERSPELPARRRQADLVWEVALGDGERVLLHIELQAQPDAAIGERLAEYALRLWRRDRLPVQSIVVYLREAGPIPAPPFVVQRGGGAEALRLQYAIIRLWEQPAERVLETEEAGVWPLAALMAGAPLATLEAVAERIARAPLPEAERGELTGLLAVLAGLRLPRPVVQEVMRRNPMLRNLLNESSVAELLREEAGAEGRTKGRAEGKEEGQRELVLAILESRFGPLEPEELAALRVAKEPTLRGLAIHSATDSREQARLRLGLA